MRWWSEVWFRIRALLSRDRMAQELGEEVEFHLEMEARKWEAAGMTPQQARRQARLRFGGEDRFREQAQRAWGIQLLTDLTSDVGFAWRQMRRNPGFSLLGVLTLALGIGGTVALFSVVHGLMLRPLPFDREDRLVAFWSEYNWRGVEFDLVREIPRSFEGVAAYSTEFYTLRGETGATLVPSVVASAELFDVLGTTPLLGRGFEMGEDRPGREPVVVLTHGLWQTQFGGTRDILGQRIDLSGTQHTVVGVMPEEFFFPSPEIQAYVPLNLDPDERGYVNNGWLVLLGRLDPNATQAQVDDDIALITQALDERFDYPEAWDKTKNAQVIELREYLLGDVRPVLLLLLGAVGLLLLMACANVTALILTRTVDRGREMSVRASLGAGWARLARQVLTESMVLGVAAGVVGVGLAVVVFDALVASLPIDASYRSTLALDWPTLVAALLLSVVTGALVSLAPIRNLDASRLAASGMNVRSTGSPDRRVRFTQSMLVGAEVLVAVVLVAGASLLIRTVGELRQLDPGFDPSDVVAVDVLLPEADRTPEERALYFDELQERVAALPGVRSVGLMNRLPLRDGGWSGPISTPDRPELVDTNRPNAMYRPVTPDLFETLGANLVAGRGIQDTDRPDGPRVAVINQTFADRVWNGQDAIGRTYQTGFVGEVTVVGVVRDIAVSDLIGQQPMTGYYPWDQTRRGADHAILLAKTDGGVARVLGSIRSLVQQLDAGAAVGRTQSMQEVMDVEMAEPLRLRFFLGLFAFLGLVLGAVGIFGVVSYAVERRRPEFGVRMALGAQEGRLLRDVLLGALKPVVIGVAVGTGVALAGSRAIAGFLFGVSPTDPWSLAASACVLLAAGAAAAWIPAIRASAVSPASALRAE